MQDSLKILPVIDRLDTSHGHPLALLAEELKKLLKKDSGTFMPVLSQRHPQAVIVSATLVHKLYGNKLKPFMDGAEHLTEDVISVFPAAERLEQFIMVLITSVCEEENAAIFCRKLNQYQIETKSGTLVLRWPNAQLERILGWVERAIQQEDNLKSVFDYGVEIHLQIPSTPSPCEKEEKSEKLKVKKVIEKNNMDGARIYAENAIRKRTEQMNYLQLASRLDACRGSARYPSQDEHHQQVNG
ncbi:hypothetical protein K1719_013684 [Acacia pycnantha]|nr:hypothetical protein K1719_013684 [Acacia pycnantha]